MLRFMHNIHNAVYIPFGLCIQKTATQVGFEAMNGQGSGALVA